MSHNGYSFENGLGRRECICWKNSLFVHLSFNITKTYENLLDVRQ